MTLSIAQLRASQDVGLPEVKVRLCLSQKLVGEINLLEREQERLEDERAKLSPKDGDSSGEGKRPRRNADPDVVRLVEIDARLAEIEPLQAALVERMREHTGELTLRAVAAGEWRRWADAHPARVVQQDDDTAPKLETIDLTAGLGLVNATALLEDFATYAVAWNGEPISETDWEFIAQNAAPGDLTQACRRVVRLHEDVGMVPKLLSPSSTTPTDESA